MLYEMLSRRPAFAGETTSDVIAAIIERAPDLSLLPAPTPAHVRRIMARCLEKDPKRRVRDLCDHHVEVPVTSRGFSAGVPQRLFSLSEVALGGRAHYSVTPDGQRFLFNLTERPGALTVLLNWPTP